MKKFFAEFRTFIARGNVIDLAVGMIVGTGGNATQDANMGSAIIEQKDIPTSIVANNRKVAICDNNSIYQSIYNNYFAEAIVEA